MQTTKSKKSAVFPSLVGESVLITGGASGIGADLVEGFVAQKARVGFLDIDADSASRLLARVSREFDVTPWFRKTDLSNASDTENAVAEAINALGGLHVLINNVGNDERCGVDELDSEAWRRCMAINLDAAFLATRAALGVMEAQQAGSIINLSSINAFLGPPDMPGYATAKAGLIGMTKSLARKAGTNRVRVNAILPGWVATEKQLSMFLTPNVQNEWQKQVALQEQLTARDVTNLALFLAADESRMITGQSLVVDAGRT